jgi:hypothetical protein
MTTAMTVKFTPNDKGNLAGKLADGELHLGEGPLAGLKLIGFAIWERRAGAGRNVTFPARHAAKFESHSLRHHLSNCPKARIDRHRAEP